ncbi:MAG: flavin reductase family protein [Alphaproteobacteria bacterium]|nr:flavin reductase family protein [Alphaproteobacteria bacterium]
MTDNSRDFRNALGCFATGVTVVTTRKADGTPVGITANSFSSVSLDPPLVLWCIDKSSDTLADFDAAGQFAINVLSAEDMNVSNEMAKPGRHSMEEHVGGKGAETGLPVVETALATFECDVESRHDAGDHIIMVGRVVGFTSTTEGDPLLYFRSKYATAAK